MEPLVLTKHAEKRLRGRTGWKRSAVKDAVGRLRDEGHLAAAVDDFAEYHFRGVRWLVKGGHIVTAIPLPT